MDRRKFLRLMLLAGLVWAVAMPGGINLAYGNAGPAGQTFYANSPSGGTTGTAIRKFIDSLPGLGSANPSTLGQYIPIAVADTVDLPWVRLLQNRDHRFYPTVSSGPAQGQQSAGI